MALLERLGRGFLACVGIVVFAGLITTFIWGFWRNIQMHQMNLAVVADLPSILFALLLSCAGLVGMVGILVQQVRPQHFSATAPAPARSLENDDDGWEDEVVWPRKGPQISPRW